MDPGLDCDEGDESAPTGSAHQSRPTRVGHQSSAPGSDDVQGLASLYAYRGQMIRTPRGDGHRRNACRTCVAID